MPQRTPSVPRPFRARFPSPVQFKAVTMPANYGRWLDDRKGTFPSGPDTGENDPEEAIGQSKLRPLLFVFVSCQLLPVGEVFGDKFHAVHAARAEHSKPQVKPVHRSVFPRQNGRFYGTLVVDVSRCLLTYVDGINSRDTRPPGAVKAVGTARFLEPSTMPPLYPSRGTASAGPAGFGLDPRQISNAFSAINICIRR